VRCAGDEAPVSFTLGYAAPEVISAHEAGAKRMVRERDADVWALGVIAFEMLTGERAFANVTTRQAVVDSIVGRLPLPWEGDRSGKLLRKLGVFKRNVLDCLQRDPALRPPIAAVVQSYGSLFRSNSINASLALSDGLPSVFPEAVT
jgi:serine/threonine protein kinase